MDDNKKECGEIMNKKTFDNLELCDELLRGIYSYGFEEPSNIQSLSVPIINKGKDLIAQAQSGTGKTGAYTIGCLNNIIKDERSLQLLVLLPTRELVFQVFDVFSEISKYMDLRIIKVIGGTNVNDCKADLRTDPHIVIGTPGRVLDMITQNCLYTDKISMLVLDEADEILSSGFSESLYNIIKCTPVKCNILLFSATIPDEILTLTGKILNNPEKILVNKEELTLEGIRQFYVNIKFNDWKLEVIKDLYDTINISQCIIYFNSKNKLNDIYRNLIDDNYPVSCIHGDLTSGERKMAMEDFKNGKTRILLSTDLLSRGIDIQQLSLVINFDLPINKEVYIHRIGRSGRYGRKGVSINLITERDVNYMTEICEFYETKIEEMPNNISDLLGI